MKRLKIIFLVFSFLMLVLHSSGQDSNGHSLFDKVVIDAGHGGYDTGARGANSKEKMITFAIALAAGKMIEDSLPGVEVIYTRKTDRFIPLNERANIANQNNADLFISIHCNSNNSAKPFGAETYVMGIHKTPENLEVAKTENAAILMEENYNETYDGFNPDSDEDYIMLNMFQSSNIEQSIQFSMLVQEKLREDAEVYDRGVKQAGFVVLYLTTMPGALVETGFLSNPAEEQFLLKSENQQKIARAIFDAVAEYKTQIDGLSQKIIVDQNKILAAAKKIPKTIYRIRFAETDELVALDDKMFEGLNEVWSFYENGKYFYTFETDDSLSGIAEKLQQYSISPWAKKSFIKDAQILKFEIFE